MILCCSMAFQAFTYAKRPSGVLNGSTIDIQLLMSESHLYPLNSDCDIDTDCDADSDTETASTIRIILS